MRFIWNSTVLISLFFTLASGQLLIANEFPATTAQICQQWTILCQGKQRINNGGCQNAQLICPPVGSALGKCSCGNQDLITEDEIRKGNRGSIDAPKVPPAIPMNSTDTSLEEIVKRPVESYGTQSTHFNKELFGIVLGLLSSVILF